MRHLNLNDYERIAQEVIELETKKFRREVNKERAVFYMMWLLFSLGAVLFMAGQN